jgi:hypothetical protein
VGIRLDGRTGNSPSSGLAPDQLRQLVRLHDRVVLKQMTRATQLAERSLAFTREVIERPYVVMVGLHPGNIETHKIPRFVVEFHNTGRTPAAVTVSVTLQDRATDGIWLTAFP